MLRRGRMYLAPAGTPYDGTVDRWQALGLVSDGGPSIEVEPTCEARPDEKQQIRSWTDAAHRTQKTVTHTFHFKASKAGHRRIIALVSGIYRLPGDPPLIRRGKKP